MVGLAETGGADDAPALRGFLAHDRPRVRRGALHGLALVRADDLAAACLRALADPSPAVAHAARDLLRRRAARVTAAQAWGAYEAATTEAGRIDALSVLGALDYWERLPYLLRATTSDAPAARDRALHETRRWVARANASFSTPSRAALDAIRAALAVAAVPDAVRRAIDAVVRSRAPAGA